MDSLDTIYDKIKTVIKYPHLIMLIGLPGSGKSTFVDNLINKHHHFTLVSSDNYIEWIAQRHSKTYDEIFKDHAKDGEKYSLARARFAIEQSDNVVWDQTNLSIKTREKRLKMFPQKYQKIAIVFEKPAEWNQILNNRPGKTIPQAILDTMEKTYQPPLKSDNYHEGFNHIFNLKCFS